ncbi:MAG: tetratricopeptide repeat protein [Actinobacteria bacterium]|nr:tetratricopeptide repeat protein [Actinomycetota bacterium]
MPQRSRSQAGRQPRKTPKAQQYEPVHFSDAVVSELHSTSRPGKAELLVQVFAHAAAAFAAEDYREAIRLGDQAKHMALRSQSIRELLGLAHYRAGNWREASKELAAFRRISGSIDQNPVLADCYRALGRPDKALELCDEVDVQTAPPPVYYEGAIVAAGALGDQGHLDEAIARLEGLDVRPTTAQEHHVRAWYALADLLERRGRFTLAREWFEAAAAAAPELTDAAERAVRVGDG